MVSCFVSWRTIMEKCIRFFSLMLFLMTFVCEAVGQCQFSIPILFQGTAASDSCRLWFGVHGDGPGGAIQDNTNCQDIDIGFSPWIENCDPIPLPEGWQFHAAFLVPNCGAGCTVLYPYDFRGFTSESQADTFLIRITGFDVKNGQVTISWPTASVLVSAGGSGSHWNLYKKVGTSYVFAVNMTSATSFVDVNASYASSLEYKIIKVGAHLPIQGPVFAFKYSSMMYGGILNYGNVRFGGSATTPVMVKNTAEVNSLIITNIAIPENYSITSNPPVACPITIAPGASQKFDVTFTPPSVGGPYSGNIVFTHNASAGTSTLSVTGNGEDGSIMITPTLRDSVFTILSHDTLFIWNTNIDVSCGPQYKLSTELLDSSKIVVTESDTCQTWSQCECIYKVYTKISDLTAGTYTVNVYRNLWGQNGVHIGTTSVTISDGGTHGYNKVFQFDSNHSNFSNLETVVPSYQSPCLNPTCYLGVSAGWNLVSVPRFLSNFAADAIFANKYGPMISYNPISGSYEDITSLLIGKGYWVYYTSGKTEIINGLAPGCVTVECQTGWNLIGAREEAVAANAIVTVPASQIYGDIFRFDNSTGRYVPTSILTPNEGHWVYVIGPCTLKIP
jgi:hypothetical protein